MNWECLEHRAAQCSGGDVLSLSRWGEESIEIRRQRSAGLLRHAPAELRAFGKRAWTILAGLSLVMLGLIPGSSGVAVAADSGITAERANQLVSAATNGTVAMRRLAELCDTFGPRLERQHQPRGSHWLDSLDIGSGRLRARAR
jgi:hypothetical protein